MSMTRTKKSRRPSAAAPKKGKGRGKKEYCVCRGADDGTPMINCSNCADWFHFRCVHLPERDAEDVQIYICPACQESTGRRSVMTWEGQEAVEPVTDEQAAKRTAAAAKDESDSEPPAAESESSAEEVSEDDYVELKGKGRRPSRRVTLSSDSEDEDGPAPSRRATKRLKSSSPDPSHSTALKRKSSGAQPTPKRKKSSASVPTSASDDPARVFCLKKYEDLFCKIFVAHPHLNQDAAAEIKPDELTPETKTELEAKAKIYASELEQSIYEVYAEQGKDGIILAGAKYKDRFRMLTFNLAKADRVALHVRIASRALSPSELARMSSAQLASEEAQQEMRQAEEEALAHSILQKTLVPRAKITHKGIEEVELEGAAREEREEREQREQEQEEKRERERRERVRPLRAASGSAPPESPATPTSSAGWGAPPPLPPHIRPPGHAMFGPSVADVGTPVDELNLADLINIDEEGGAAESPMPALFEQTVGLQTPATTTAPGVSPFAPNQPQRQRSASFDLNSLWIGRGKEGEGESGDAGGEEGGDGPNAPAEVEEPRSEVADGLAEDDEADQDFDMFLDSEQGAQPPPPPPVEVSPDVQQANFDAAPTVWSGKISMPLDSTVPEETPVVARQMGGQPLEAGSPLWKTLFPNDHLRIDGRVAIDKSSNYLLQMRMNPAKELIAVAFSSVAGGTFEPLADYLTAKERHGLVFPWGHRPSDHHPGRELYIIPLRAGETIPEFMELLDDLSIPKIRTTNYLVGIWILNKGKLAPPPAPPAPPVPAPAASAPAPTTDLAAQVASLTPEQIQAMLATLASSGVAIPGTQPHSAPAPPKPPVPPIPVLGRSPAQHPPPPFLPQLMGPPLGRSPVQHGASPFPPQPSVPVGRSPAQYPPPPAPGFAPYPPPPGPHNQQFPPFPPPNQGWPAPGQAYPPPPPPGQGYPPFIPGPPGPPNVNRGGFSPYDGARPGGDRGGWDRGGGRGDRGRGWRGRGGGRGGVGGGVGGAGVGPGPGPGEFARERDGGWRGRGRGAGPGSPPRGDQGRGQWNEPPAMWN